MKGLFVFYYYLVDKYIKCNSLLPYSQSYYKCFKIKVIRINEVINQ